MTEREVSSERVSEDFVEQVAKEIAKHTYARCLPQMSDCEDWDAMEEADRKIYRSAAEAVLALRSSVKTVGEFTLDEEELDTILAVGRNEQSGRITNYELKELVRVYRAALEASSSEQEAVAGKGEQRTICDACGNSNLAHDRAVWTDDGSSFCPGCAPSPAAESELTEKRDELLDYILQDDLYNRLTPRIVDIAYTAFTLAKAPNDEDGGPSDWFTDTKPFVNKMIEKVRSDLTSALKGGK